MTTPKMTQFVNRPQQTPLKASALARIKNYDEIYNKYDEKDAQLQAGRCEQCGVPFCQIHCPLGNNIPDWLMLTAEGRLEEAYKISQATNTFPEICGRICPQDRLCEGNCVLEQSGHDYVTIGSVEKYITETAWQNGWVKPVKPARERSESVAIIGAGPAGLAAAVDLRQLGFQVVVYDRHDRVGGLLIYGIPNFKLDKQVVLRRTQWLIDSGVKFVLNHDVAKDFADIRQKHHAVLVATGVYKAREADMAGRGLKNVIQALDYLTQSNRANLGDTITKNADLSCNGQRVVVIGGGDTAMDCVRTAIRQGAKSVVCLYRRDRDNMPGSDREVQNAMDEGVEFRWLSAPNKILGNDKVEGIEITKMRLTEKAHDGRQSVVAIDGSEEVLHCDKVIMALGFEAEDLPHLFGDKELPVNKNGTIAIKNTAGATNARGVFAAGDIARGASLVVWAIKDGKMAAQGIRKFLNEQISKQKAA